MTGHRRKGGIRLLRQAGDSEERLRRLFTILIVLADPAPPVPGTDPSAALTVMGLRTGSRTGSERVRGSLRRLRARIDHGVAEGVSSLAKRRALWRKKRGSRA